MKKIIYIKTQILFMVLMGLFYKAQDNSISASVQAPVSYQTGVPDISFPLVSLPAAKDFTLNFGLTYNPNSYKMGEYCGQIARNWSLSGSNFMITRSMSNDGWIDETQTYEHNVWDDIYYYNLNGEQGSFKFEKIGGLYHPNLIINLIKLTPSNIKIEFERETTGNKAVRSFTITDSKGYKYYFQDYSFQQFSYQGDVIGTILKSDMRNAFYVTKIVDSDNKQIALFQNKKITEYEEHSNNTIIKSWLYIPETITTEYGKILIDHGDSGTLWNFHDRYYFKSFTLKDHKENFVSKNVLDFSNSSYQFFDIDMFQTLENVTIDTRFLTNIKRLDQFSNVVEKTKFGYNTLVYKKYGANHSWWGDDLAHLGIFKDDNPNFLLYGLLKTVSLPTGGKIEYEYGANQIKSLQDKNSSAYIQEIQNPSKPIKDAEIQYLKKVDSIVFDSKVNKIYHLTNLQHSPNTRIYIQFNFEEIYPWENNPENPWKGGIPTPDPKLAYKIRNAINTYSNGPPTANDEITTQFSSYHYVVPANGTAYIEILGSGGRGEFYIYERTYTAAPYVNRTLLPNSGVRIEQIKYYDKAENSSTYYPTFSLRKIIDFDYNSFNEPDVSSGKSVPENDLETIIYKNIKITESDKPGYTKYFYNIPDDYPSDPNLLAHHYNFTKKGILSKKEVYNNSNTKKLLTDIEYVFIPNNTEASLAGNLIPDKINSTETSYDSAGNSLTATSEKTFNQQNNNLMKEKKTTADGTVMETEYQYAAEKANTKLLGASMFSVPLEVTQKQNNTAVGKVETFYNHAGNYFPSSVKSTGINGVTLNEEKNDIYDTMGNVLQSTSKTGIPTAYIYGYNGTLLIAKIDGLKYSDVMTAMGQPATIDAYKNLEIYTQSNLDIDDISEETLRQKLDAFRLKPAFKNYQITTYTYDPLIGTKSVTSPSGNKEYYYYDNANRMIRVEDINHNVIKENKYKHNLNN